MAIDVGPGATDRSTQTGVTNLTIMDETNPANATGTLDVVELWFQTAATQAEAGTFSGSGTSWTSRDSAVIGNVAAGSKQTFSGLSIDVQTGDLVGVYFNAGKIEADTSGGIAWLYKVGNQFGAGAQTYTRGANNVISIYGTGTEAGGAARRVMVVS